MSMDKKTTYLTNLDAFVTVDDATNEGIDIKEVTLTESLLTPGLQTSIIVQSQFNTPYLKNLNNFYGKDVYIEAERPIIRMFSKEQLKHKFKTNQIIYRLSNRRRLNNAVEEFQLDACDITLLRDAKSYFSKSWSCVPPSEVVKDVMNECLKPLKMEIEDAQPNRDYIAENLHPFQIITQQANMGLSIQNDPSFMHYMTYQDFDGNDIPTHNFKSLSTLGRQRPFMEFVYSGKVSIDINYASPFDILDYSFPCDFDLLSDILNGYDEEGNERSGLIVFNKLTGAISIYGELEDCGATDQSAATNIGSEDLQNSCNVPVDKYLRKRPARMALIEQDKITLRLTVPFSPMLNVGKVIRVKIPNVGTAFNGGTAEDNYGSGEYLIVNMTHNIKLGGMGVTIMDCVAQSIAAGS